MNAKQLIEENNRKRELLTPENEEYYGDLLLYIRLKLTLSEQQSEEVLMELLDHLLDAQETGKTARDIFGDDPKGYADEIIEQLPKEEKRKLIPFIGGIILDIIGWVLVIRGGLLLILSHFTEVEVKSTVHPISTLGIALVMAGFILFTIVYIFKIIDRSLFTEKPNAKKDSIKAGLVGALGMAVILLFVKFLPEIGPAFEFPWWVSLLVGVIILIALYARKKLKGQGNR